MTCQQIDVPESVLHDEMLRQRFKIPHIIGVEKAKAGEGKIRQFCTHSNDRNVGTPPENRQDFLLQWFVDNGLREQEDSVQIRRCCQIVDAVLLE